MKKLIIYVTTLMIVCFATTVYARRLSPKPVTPVIKDGIEYSAPLELMEYVVAKRIKTNREIWRKQIYEVKFNLPIERGERDKDQLQLGIEQPVLVA